MSNLLAKAQPLLLHKRISQLVPWWAALLRFDLAVQDSRSSDQFPIDVPSGDSSLDPESSGNVTIPFARSLRIQPSDPRGPGYIQIQNTLSSVIDLTSIYGANKEVLTTSLTPGPRFS